MKNICFILSIFFCAILTSCQVKNEKNNVSNDKKTTEKISQDSIVEDDNNTNCFPEYHELKEIDTLSINDYIICFQTIEAEPFQNYYPDQKTRDSITKPLHNSYEKARAIEDYLYPKHENLFIRNDSILSINLANGQQIVFSPENGCVFEHYFEDIDYILLFVQRYEGNSYMLINRKNGHKRYINGHPYFSPSKKSFVTGEVDLLSGYNINGLYYYEIKSDTIEEMFEIRISNWGPENIKWVTKNSISIKQTFVDFENSNELGFMFYEGYTRMSFIKSLQ